MGRWRCPNRTKPRSGVRVRSTTPFRGGKTGGRERSGNPPASQRKEVPLGHTSSGRRILPQWHTNGVISIAEASYRGQRRYCSSDGPRGMRLAPEPISRFMGMGRLLPGCLILRRAQCSENDTLFSLGGMIGHSIYIGRAKTWGGCIGGGQRYPREASPLTVAPRATRGNDTPHGSSVASTSLYEVAPDMLKQNLPSQTSSGCRRTASIGWRHLVDL